MFLLSENFLKLNHLSISPTIGSSKSSPILSVAIWRLGYVSILYDIRSSIEKTALYKAVWGDSIKSLNVFFDEIIFLMEERLSYISQIQPFPLFLSNQDNGENLNSYDFSLFCF